MLYTTHPDYLHYIHIYPIFITISLVESQCLMVALRASTMWSHWPQIQSFSGVVSTNNTIKYQVLSRSYGKWYIYLQMNHLQKSVITIAMLTYQRESNIDGSMDLGVQDFDPS
jgi:hypothetical protein